MLNLNQRLGTYLTRVKHLEEENALLAKEIQTLRHSNHGALSHRKSLEEELRQARLEVDAAWKHRVYTALEVGKLTEELQTLDLQRQKVAQARVDANKKFEKSRQELEEEHRAQIWLRQKVSQLENEMKLLIQNHQDNVAHLEAKITHSRSTVPTTFAQRGNLTPNLLQLDQEYSQRANRAWQETADAYQGQLAWLEESLNQARSRLMQVGQEKSESQLKLRALEKEIASAQDVRMHLEKTAFQQRDKYSLEIQQLQVRATQPYLLQIILFIKFKSCVQYYFDFGSKQKITDQIPLGCLAPIIPKYICLYWDVNKRKASKCFGLIHLMIHSVYSIVVWHISVH